jgi:hypothetical protein
MRNLASYCIATTALLALTLSSHASPGSSARASLNFTSGFDPFILAADEPKAGDEKKTADEKKPADEKKSDEKKAADDKMGDDKKAAEDKKGAEPKKAADEAKPADEKKTAETKKKRSERTVSKREIMRHIRQYVPEEYQGYIQEGRGRF